MPLVAPVISAVRLGSRGRSVIADIFRKFVPGTIFEKNRAWHEFLSVERTRPFDDVALHEVDAAAARRGERRAVLDLLGDDAEIERAREPDHRADHLAIHAVLAEVAGVDAVDLHVVERELLQVSERAD